MTDKKECIGQHALAALVVVPLQGRLWWLVVHDEPGVIVNLVIHGAALTLFYGQEITSTLLYPVSLLIGGWDWVQGGNPLYAAVKCLSVSRGQIWQIFFIFFAKSTWHIHFLTSLFFWACTKFFSLLKLTFLFGYHHFSKIEGPFPKLRVRAVRGFWALLLLLIIPALIQCFD